MTTKINSRILQIIHLLIVVCLLSIPAQAKYGGGDGTAEDPYLIYTAEQMNTIGIESSDWSKHFKLMANIDLSQYTGTDFNIIGYRQAWDDNNAFSGVFDGDNHTISNFTYVSLDANHVGLFGYVDGPEAQIKDLGLIDANIVAGVGQFVGSLVGELQGGTISGCFMQSSTISGGEDVGGLVGRGSGFWRWEPGVSIIINCCAITNVIGIDRVGGLVGSNEGTTISSCYSTGSVSGVRIIGGLVGQNGNWYSGREGGLYAGGFIYDCYSNCDVMGVAKVGGLVGFNYVGDITRCYSSGAVLDSELNQPIDSYDGLFGGLVADNEARTNIKNCFWDMETSGLTVSAGGMGKTTTQMQTAETFLSWGACGSLWTIDEGLDHPHLAWENMPGGFISSPAYGGGTGIANDPYLVYTAEQLNMIGLYYCHWDKHFKLMDDVDLSAFDGKEGRMAFNIIGTDRRDSFTGVFDGNGHTISNLTLAGEDNLGMFGCLESGAEVRDLGVVDVNISGLGDFIGALAGCSYGEVIRCYSSGTVRGEWSVGGLVGASLRYPGIIMNGTMTQCYSSCVVSGNDWLGGLVGSNSGVITQCYSTGGVNGNGRVGGLVGNNSGYVTNCYSTNAVDGDSLVGGLIGRNYLSPISQCYSTGAVTGNSSVGGLVGSDYGGDDVALSFWDMQTSGQAISDGGAGKTTAEMQIARTFFTWGGSSNDPVWTIDEGNDYPRLWWEDKPGEEIKPVFLSDFLLGAGTDDDPYLIYTPEQLNQVGLGVCDWYKHFNLMADIDLSNYSDSDFHPIGRPYSFPFTGIFDGNGHSILNFSYTCIDDNSIGLFGYVDNPSAEIKNLRLVEPNIDAGAADRVGLLVGYMRSGTIMDCYIECGSVKANCNVAGLVGFNDRDGQVSKCYSTCAVNGYNYLGGLVGRNWGAVVCCYSNGTVSSSEGYYVGGLIGWNVGTVTNSYSTATASAKWAVGGLVGSNSGDVNLCYSTGAVRGSTPFGGLVGYGSGDTIRSFWDTQTTGRPYSNGGTGLNTTEMQMASTFLEAGWDFVGEIENGTEDIWWILEGQDYPRLWWEAEGNSSAEIRNTNF